MSKSKAQSKKAKRLLLLLGNWATESNFCQDTQSFEETIDETHDTFLNSPEADDHELRVKVMFVYKQLKDLCVVMHKLTPELVSEIQHQVIAANKNKSLDAL